MSSRNKKIRENIEIEDEKKDVELTALYDKAYTQSLMFPSRTFEEANRILKRAEEKSNLHFQALAYYLMGAAGLHGADYNVAMKSFEKGYSLSLQHNLKTVEVKFHNAFGVVYYQLGSLSEAYGEYSTGLDAARALGLITETGQLLTNIGLVSLRRGESTEAQEFFEEAVELIDKINNDIFTTSALDNLSSALLAQSKLDEAEKVSLRSLKISRSAEILKHEVVDLCKLARIYQKQGDLTTALNYAEECLSLGADKKFPDIHTDVQLCLAEIHAERQDYSKALSLYDEALERIQTYPLKPLLASTLEARARLKHAAALYESSFQDLLASMEAIKSWHREESKKSLEALEKAWQLDKFKKVAETEQSKRQELELANTRLHVITDVGESLTASHDPKDVLHNLWTRLKAIISIDYISIGLYSQDLELINAPIAIHKGDFSKGYTVYLTDEASIAVRCLREEAVIYYQTQDEALKAQKQKSLIITTEGEQLHSLLFLPLLREQKAVGVLIIQSVKKNAYDEQTIEMLTAIASFVSIAIENFSIVHALERHNETISHEKKQLEKEAVRSSWQAEHDVLTGLSNRLYVNNVLDTLLQQCDAEKTQVVLFYMDLNNFKPINDSYGHDAGDRILKIVAQRLLSLFRSSDIIARVGGDEFIALVRGVSQKRAPHTIASKLIKAFAEPFDLEEGAMRIGISIGFAIYPEDAKDGQDLMKKADAAMYKAKRSKSNRWLQHSDEEA